MLPLFLALSLIAGGGAWAFRGYLRHENRARNHLESIFH